MNLSKSFIWFFFAVLTAGSALAWVLFDKTDIRPENDWSLPIIPHPQEIQLKDEKKRFILNENTKINLIIGSEEADRVEPEILNTALGKKGLESLEVILNKAPAKNQIIVGDFKNGNKIIDSLVSSNGLQFNPRYPGPEGYFLDISADYVLVAGYDSSGTFYGVQSLFQLINNASDLTLAPVTIIDYPDMPLRSAFYGFYLNTLENNKLIKRAYVDFKKFSQLKFNMIDLASHHYGHLEMEVPNHNGQKLWEKFGEIHQEARRYNLRPRVGGWAKWVNTNSSWGADLTTLECIRSTQKIKMNNHPHTLKISPGEAAPNVIYDFSTVRSLTQEPVIVSNKMASIFYKEGKDYVVNFGKIQSEPYQKYGTTSQTNLEALFSKVHHGEGEPTGYPLRWAETFNPSTTIQRLPEGRIEENQEVNVTFSYIGPDPWSILKVRYCRSDKRLHTDGPENYIWRWCTEPVRFWDADDFSLDVDETRVFAWDKRCLGSGKSRSQIWVDDIHYYYQTIRGANASARISMWSDMIDPEHNATLYGTDQAVSLIQKAGMIDIMMIPWKSSIAEASVRFFAENGFAIMPSSQETTKAGYSVAPKWAKLIREFYSNKNVPFGLMHCSWDYKYDTDLGRQHLETVADHAWSVAPYILHTPVKAAMDGDDIEIMAKFEGDNYIYDGEKVRPGPLPLKTAFLFYRINERSSFTKLEMTNDEGEFKAIIPDTQFKTKTIEYYIEMSDEFHTSLCPPLSKREPFSINVIKK